MDTLINVAISVIEYGILRGHLDFGDEQAGDDRNPQVGLDDILRVAPQPLYVDVRFEPWLTNSTTAYRSNDFVSCKNS